MAELIVSGPLLRIQENLLGLVNLFELLFSAGLPVAVRMVLECKGPKSLLYLVLRSVLVDAEDFVIVTFFSHI